MKASIHDARLRPSTAVRASISTDGLVLLDVTSGLILASNLVGARIWQLIDQRYSHLEIARQLVADYGISEERARSDLATFVVSLVERGLVAEDPQL